MGSSENRLARIEEHNAKVLLAVIEKHVGPDSETMRWAKQRLQEGATVRQVNDELIANLWAIEGTNNES